MKRTPALPTKLHPDNFRHFLTFRNTTIIQTYPWNDNDEVFSLNYSKHAQKSRNIPAKTDPETAHTGFPQFHIYNQLPWLFRQSDLHSMNGSGNNFSCDIKVSLVFNEVLVIKAKIVFFTYNKTFAISTNSLIPEVFILQEVKME